MLEAEERQDKKRKQETDDALSRMGLLRGELTKREVRISEVKESVSTIKNSSPDINNKLKLKSNS